MGLVDAVVVAAPTGLHTAVSLPEVTSRISVHRFDRCTTRPGRAVWSGEVPFIEEFCASGHRDSLFQINWLTRIAPCEYPSGRRGSFGP